ncbi:Protein kinase domain-containing protein [Caenorhabditis elegans]|uniref:Protein kinase domain-containing protein n=1 Tax=Caenorhabditis elegans TaxID=6239 RepID=Q21373_CAEEL|nr:Protein kinase domain-containing protein [Caenorhabditis elegans]CAA94155.2 Protein kinase domain-containing protein [Caenorhabditis elegans]
MACPYVDDVLRNYKIVEVLGSGEYGTAFACVDADSRHSTLALKASNLETIFCENCFKLERTVLQRISTLGTNEKSRFPTLVDNFVVDSTLGCLVMTKEGDSLGDVCKRNDPKKFSPTNVLKIMLSVGKSLQTIHSLGYIHRDIHWNNVLFAKTITPASPCKLIDYGVGKKFRNRRGNYVKNRPQRDVNFKECGHVSWNVMMGGVPNLKDDFSSLMFLGLKISGISSLEIGSVSEVRHQKMIFELDPSRFLRSVPWLLKVACVIVDSDAEKFNYAGVFNAIKQGFPFDEEEIINHSYLQGSLKVY